MIEFTKDHWRLISLSIVLVLLDIFFVKGFFYTLLLFYGLFIKLLLSEFINGKFRKVLAITIWAAFIAIGSLTAYVNWYLPHGPLIDTGDVVCQNDGRGPCGESYIEDTRGLHIPDWAKFLRTSEAGSLIFALAFAGAVASYKREDEVNV